MTRLDELRVMLEGRTESDGSPKRGYARNVLQLRAEIRRLEALDKAQEAQQSAADDESHVP